MKNEILIVCDQLVAAAANGVYQGIIIAILVALGLRFLGRTNAATRHAVWFCTMLLLVALIVVHCLVDSFSFRRVTPNVIVPFSKAELATVSTDAGVLPEIETAIGNSSHDSANFCDDSPVGLEELSSVEHHPLLVALIQAQRDSAGDVTEPEQPNGVEPGNAQSDDDGLASNLSGGTTGLRRLTERLLNPISVELALGSKFPKFASMILLALWLTIASFRVFTLIVQLAQIQKLKQQSLPPGAELNALFQKLSAQLLTDCKVELRVSPAHRSSFLLGFLHPVVLLPAEERMELLEAELVLRHELAHVQRRDDWVNLIQHFFLAVFFFHPAFWWISRQLSLEREIACDDHVLHQSKRPQAYALVLANLAARMQRRLPLLAPGSSNNKTQLRERIDMILNTHRNASPRLAKTWLAFITSSATLVAAAVICSAPRIVLAQIEETAAIAPPADVPPVPPVNDIAPDIAPPTPLPAVVDRGPKFKPGNLNVDVRPAVVVAPTAPVPVSLNASPAVSVAPVVPLAPMAARLSVIAAAPGQPTPFLASIEPPSEPQTPRAPRPARAPRSENNDSSLEQRLDRLERMIDSLVNQQNPKGRSDLQLKLEKEGMIDRKELAKIDALAKQQAELAHKINPQEIEKFKEQAEREARRAVEQAKRAAVEVEKAQKASQKQAERKLKADSQRQLEALRRQSEALERQREKLDREIERLEQDQEQLDEQDDDSADSNTELSESKEVCVTQSHSHSSQ